MGRGAMISLVMSDVHNAVAADHKIASLRVFDRRTAIEEKIEQRMSYAILSHRWLDEGEVTFQDMTTYSHDPDSMPSGDAARPGLQKLTKFCEMAVQYGCDWAWADTCCIDKRSSAELDESIRSMYKWYLYSKVCIVYLSGTLKIDDMPSDAWFHRGWTLQELLASPKIKFYNMQWMPIVPNQADDKADSGFLDRISAITGIPSLDLYRFSASTDRIREKMVWASKRKTTRIEDIAYSLIGIFDVSLVIAYGEGRRAFYRLQTAIMEKTDSVDLLIWEGHPSRDHSMVAWGPECFTEMDRSDEFTRLLVPLPGRTRLQCEEVARTLMPRGPHAFAMANAGLRMELILYDVNAVELSPPTDGHTRYRLTLERSLNLQGPILVEPLNISLTTGIDSPGKMKLGIVDYERDDIKDQTGYRRTLLENDMYYFWVENAIARHQARTGKYTTYGDHDVRKLLAEAEKCITTARADRWYTAILLQPGTLRKNTYSKVPTRRIIQLKRPKRSRWKLPVPVYVV